MSAWHSTRQVHIIPVFLRDAVLARPYDSQALLGLHPCFGHTPHSQTDMLHLLFLLNAYLSPYPDGRITPTGWSKVAVSFGGHSSTILLLARRYSHTPYPVASLPAFVMWYVIRAAT